MKSIINIRLPKNINFVCFKDNKIKLSTATFLPNGYEYEHNTFLSCGKIRKRYVRTEFTIPYNLPINEIWNKSNIAYQKATKKLRIDIAKYKLSKQQEYLSLLELL